MKLQISHTLYKHVFLVAFLIFYFLAISYKLIYHPTPFFDWDESLYVQTGKEMIEQKKLLLPVWQTQYWLDKPPLTSLFYSTILKAFFFIPPEISTRLASLFISLSILLLLYILYLKVIKDKIITNLIIVLTAFTPLFLQRAQTVNADVFVLLGWVGYLLFFDNFLLGLFFLTIAVMSKSFIGFYPIVILLLYHSYFLLNKKVSLGKFKKVLFRMSMQIAPLAFWHFVMFLIFGKQFLFQYVIESHFRRVSSSIEFHFGQRTFYIDLAKDQFGIFFGLALVGLALTFLYIKNKKYDIKDFLISNYLLPWFLFLNLTKTKIFWYIYPSLPQFAFLSILPLTLFKNKYVQYCLVFIILIFILQASFLQRNNFFNTFYSKYEPHYYLANYAKNKCSELNILLDKDSRKSFAELEKMNLLITTTKWWGSHPSIVYYFGKKVNFLYSEKEINRFLNLSQKNNCLVIDKNDLDLKPEDKGFTFLKNFNFYYLFER